MQATSKRNAVIAALFLGMLLCFGATTVCAQDESPAVKLVEEIREALVKDPAAALGKIEELKALDPTNKSIKSFETMAQQKLSGTTGSSNFDKPADWVAKTAATPVPTPRPTPVPEPVVYEQPEGSFFAKAGQSADKGIKWFSEQEIYVQGGVGLGVLIVLYLLIKVLFLRKKDVVSPVATATVLGGGLPNAPGLPQLGGIGAGGGMGLPSMPSAPAMPQMPAMPAMPPAAPMGAIPVAPVAPAAPQPAFAPQAKPAPAAPAAPQALTAEIGVDAMTQSTANLMRDIAGNMEAFSADPNNDIPGMNSPDAEFNLDALYAPKPAAPAPAPALTKGPETLDISSMFGTPDPAPAAAPAIPAVAKPATGAPDLSALFAEDPFGTSAPAPAPADDGGDAFYTEQLSNAQKAIKDGRYQEAINYLNIVTALNPNDDVAKDMLERAKMLM